MPPRRSYQTPPTPMPKAFASIQELDLAISKLRRRIEDVQRLDPSKIRYDDAIVDTVESNINSTILEVFGPASPEYSEHQYHRIWKGPMSMGMPPEQYQKSFAEGVPDTVTILEGLIGRLEEKKMDFRPAAPVQVEPPTKHRIFIGHGRSEVWKQLKDFLSDRLHLEYEEFNRESPAGYTTPERLQQMLDGTNFAFLIMTAEDEHSDGTKHARENVIHEVGLFQGRHGFKRAIVLLEDGCPEFSNIHGLNQIRFPPGDIMARSEEIRRVLEREGFI